MEKISPWDLEPDLLLNGGEKILSAAGEMEILWTPGHSPGHVCLYGRDRRVVWAGFAALVFAWAPVPEPWRSRMSTMDFAMKLLEEANVAVSPGSGFGPSGEGFLRMALVENENRLRQALRQIGRVVGERGAKTVERVNS